MKEKITMLASSVTTYIEDATKPKSVSEMNIGEFIKFITEYVLEMNIIDFCKIILIVLVIILIIYIIQVRIRYIKNKRA